MTGGAAGRASVVGPVAPVVAVPLPAGVAAAEAFELHGSADALFPAERTVVARALPKRIAEFVSGRRCAREALAALGLAPGALPSGPRREPLWPDGVVGSITHCPGYCAAAVALRTSLRGIGIDAEPHAPLPRGVLVDVSSAGERAALDDLPGDRHWDRLLFSAKESVYKAWYPMTGGWLDFGDAEVDFDAAGGAFTARVSGGGRAMVLHGRFAVTAGLALTSVVVPVRTAGPGPSRTPPAVDGRRAGAPRSRTAAG